jgi:hypothetical protein
MQRSQEAFPVPQLTISFLKKGGLALAPLLLARQRFSYDNGRGSCRLSVRKLGKRGKRGEKCQPGPGGLFLGFVA